jgi:hypothetical protein
MPPGRLVLFMAIMAHYATCSEEQKRITMTQSDEACHILSREQRYQTVKETDARHRSLYRDATSPPK